MAKEQPWKAKGMKKDEWLAEEVAKAVGAGKPWKCDTVDFSDPNRPPTCIEVDFPIVPINQIASIEAASGAAKKPIYQMSKWWARRQSSVFRSILLASSIMAPDDSSKTAKLIWDVYYGNHQKKGAFKHLKVADIFMGGGTTIVEGSRLGMQMYGNDLNPVAWFIVKNEMSKVDKAEVEALLADIEAEVKPQIMPFYTCDCPRGHKGKWTQVSSGKIMGDDFDPFAIAPEQRKDYSYEGPEITYVFWAKHGPCQVTGCNHRTPIMSNLVMAVKTLTVKSWKHQCKHCKKRYDIEARDARMAPGVPLVIAETEYPYAVAKLNEDSNKPESVICPNCGKLETLKKTINGYNKKVELSLLVHPNWLRGEANEDPQGRPYGGSAGDSIEDTIRWNRVRANKCRLIEVRGNLPQEFVCPETNITIITKNSNDTASNSGLFICGECGKKQKVVESVKHTAKLAPVAPYAIQLYCPECECAKEIGGGRYFSPSNNPQQMNYSEKEWNIRKNSDLQDYWPKSKIPFGHMTNQRQPLPQHGYSHFWKMFNSRQLLVHAQLIKQIKNSNKKQITKEFLLGAFLQYLRLNNMFSIWHKRNSQISAFFSSANYQPKSTTLESGVFCNKGDGSWISALRGLKSASDWKNDPWDLLIKSHLLKYNSDLVTNISGKSLKVKIQDPQVQTYNIAAESSTQISYIGNKPCDLIITDPPFGGLVHYSELSDFFYVWLQIALLNRYPEIFSAEYTPKTLEAVANCARQPGKDEESNKDKADIFYQRILTECWKEAFRILKPGGILAFTFHHSEDAPWVSVLESLFDAGFYLAATYPIRSDETKGKGEFGSKKIEYDIIHVCRKRNVIPKAVSWAKLRRQILQDVSDLQNMLEHHYQKDGLPEADLQVIRRGKALEYFSRHYGKVYKDPETPMTVLEALIGINQLLDEENHGVKEQPPHNAEPFTRMLLRLFDGVNQLPRDQIQKFLRGTGSAPSDYADRGWIYEEKKIFYLTQPIKLAHSWGGRQRKGMTSDYDQAMFFIGACFEGSGINAGETLNNKNFSPHPALGSILTWFENHGADKAIRNAAIMAAKLYRNWESKNQSKVKQLSLFDKLGEEESEWLKHASTTGGPAAGSRSYGTRKY